MKSLVISIVFSFAIVSSACRTPVPATDAESWNGIFTTKKDGDQKISAFLSFKNSNGVFNMPDLIPVPLDINNLKKWNDSISFNIEFRSGAVEVKVFWLTKALQKIK